MLICKYKGMYVCNYARIKVCIMCICNYASIKIYRYQPCKYEIMERFMYKRIKSIQVCRACMQIFKCLGMPLCMYESTQVSNYVIMHPCEYANIWVCVNQLLPHKGLFREFQLSLKSCNLASWTKKWHDYVPRYDKSFILWLKALAPLTQRINKML